MGTLQIGAENAPSDNTSVSAANGGGVTPGTGAGGIFSSAAAMNGLYGYRINSTGSPTVVWGLQVNAGAQAASVSNSIRSRIYVRISAYPAAGMYGSLLTIRRNSNTDDLCWLQIQSDGTLVFRDCLDAAIGGVASTFVMPLNTWCRIEMNLAPSNTNAANSRGMVWVGLAGTAPRTINDATSFYMYSAAINMWGASTVTVAPGIGSFVFGKNVATSYGALFDWDDIAVDNSVWTTTTSSWWGKSLTVMTVGNVMSVAPRFFINNPTSVPVKYSDVPLNLAARMNVDTDVSHSVVLAVRGSPAMTLFPVLGKESTLAMSAGSSLLIGADPVLHPFALPMSVLGSLVLNRGPNSIPSVLAAQIVARLTMSGYRATTATWVADVLTSALYGPSVDVQGVLGMDAGGQLIMAMSDLWVDTWRTVALARMELPGERLVLGTFAADGVGGLDLLGLASKTSVLAMNSPPRLVVNGLKNQSQVWKADALPRLIIAGRLNQSRVLSMSAIGQLLIAARVLHDEIIYDDVIARVLEWRHRADLFTGEVLSGVISATAHSALFLHTDSLALLLPSGNDAVILE